MKYTSQQKAALADLPELRPLILEVLKKLGRGLATFQHKQRSAKVLQQKFDIVTQMIPVLFRTCQHVRGHLLADHMPVISDVLDTPIYCEREGKTVVFNASSLPKIVFHQQGQERLEPKSSKTFEARVWRSTLMNPLFRVTFDRAFAQHQLPAYVPWNQLPHADMSLLDKLHQIVINVCHSVSRGRAPAIHLRSRQSSNLVQTPEGYWTLLDKLTARDMRKKRSALQVTRLLKMVEFFILQITSNKRSSLRQTYYISESWGRAVKFDNQSDSDNAVEDIEVLTNFPRENFGIYAEERGHAFGALKLKHVTRNGLEQIDLRDSGGSGYSIPFDVNLIEPVSMEAKYILCIEGSAMYRRLKDQNFHETAGCVLVSLTGQPPRSTRLFVKKVAEHFNVPVLMFIDCDGWSKMIAATMYMGAVKTAHMSEFLTTTSAKILGVSIHDVLAYDLPTDRLSKRDRMCLQLLLKNPRFATQALQTQIRLQLQKGVKSEQQAFAKYGLEFVVKVYLPIKLAQLGLWPHAVPQWTKPAETDAGDAVKVSF